MKIQGEKYETMKAAMKAAIDTAGGAAAINLQIAEKNLGLKSAAWDIWWTAWRQIQKDRPDFDIYTDDVNDVHIFTAVLKISKESGVTSSKP